ncbi:hypothetical protein F5Y16DRAFT_397727 [Xylariaceae sp. FL0255]|nr:hypothetical protein F5Y16DRAFT_397727 [Xylariaceae sp. FL0255]
MEEKVDDLDLSDSASSTSPPPEASISATQHTHYTISEDSNVPSLQKKLFAIQKQPDSGELATNPRSRTMGTNQISAPRKPPSPLPDTGTYPTRRHSPRGQRENLRKPVGKRISSTHENERKGLKISENFVMQQKIRRVRELKAEISQLKESASISESTGAVSVRMQVFHCLESDDHDGSESSFRSDDGRPDHNGRVYLFGLEWEIEGGEISLKAYSRVSNPRGYLENAENISFAIFKIYAVKTQRSAVESAIKRNSALPSPKPVRQEILLVSPEMIDAMSAYFLQYPNFHVEYPEINVKKALPSPFVWWYHFKNSHHHPDLNPHQRQLVKTLTDWIDSEYSPIFENIENQLRRGCVSASSIEYLIRPGQVIINSGEGNLRGHIATSRSFQWEDYDSLEIDLGDKEEIEVANLNIKPLDYAESIARDTLRRRGLTWMNCRSRRLISYLGDSKNPGIAGQRFMLDFDTYKELHPNNQYSDVPNSTKSKSFDAVEVGEPEVYVFPPLIPGFDIRRKKRTNLEIDNVRDVDWNGQAFTNLVADEDTKEFILALITNQLADEKGTDLIKNKGNGLILLLHGPPGTGKTFTAESVAEIAQKPLYTVTCGDIGTQPEEVEKYLESVFYLGKIWDCVVLLDEAEVFLEQRTLQDLHRNALVSVFLRALEYYNGILILTTNRVGTFDEAFKSRIQLALRYEKLGKSERKQIWKNFFGRLKDLGEEENIDFDDVEAHYDDLAAYEMNGRQIRNTITTARQLAKYKKRKMVFAHLKRAIALAEKFDNYLADVREGDIEESGDKRVDGRYSDEYFARADQLR